MPLPVERSIKQLGSDLALARRRRHLALSKEVGLKPSELDDFVPAFEHDQIEATRHVLGK